MRKQKLFLILIGFLQAAGVGIYCALVAGLLRHLEKFLGAAPKVGGVAFMLLLLVFSVAVVGSLIFGYPVYLTLHRRIKEALFLVFGALFWILTIIVSSAVILAV